MARIQKQMLIDTHKQNLQMLANEKAAQINMFLEFQKERLLNLSSMIVFKEVALNPNDTSKIEAAKKTINDLKSTISGISVLTKEGIVIVGDIDLPNTDYGQHPYFVAKREDTTFTQYYDPLRKNDYYAIIGPIYDSADTTKIIGRIAFDIELDKISSIMQETIESPTNEVYLIDEKGLLLSRSEFIGQDNKKGVLIQEIKSEAAKECLDHLKLYGKNGFVEEHVEEVPEYLNYMGNKVFGAHAYAPAIMGCVIAEENADEILGVSMLDSIFNIFSKK
ncbi:MAG: cache domain-containing protein [Patescibacteria group bacterium]|nr:cache domain-containing protein [Patescibacteria group bacterium]